ncbi:hypothetical protein [Streptomyces sp. NPDC020681]|uniref:hypothetical protein n=1 Tax=Streptomyces sp. NPDC020681 TaxID=3365083 RepID=UPI0037A64626
MTSDLESNAKEQARINAEIEALHEQLRALQHDNTVLVNMQQALGGGSPVAEADITATPTVPQQASGERKQSKPKKAATAPKKTTSKKIATKPAKLAKPSKSGARPTLVDLIRSHLAQQSEPRSAAEVSTTLAEAHPDRNIKVTVVRTTLEGLVAKSHAHRTKQGSSVFYTAAAASEPSEAEPQPETVAG